VRSSANGQPLRLPLSRDWRNHQRMADQAEQVSTSGLVDTKQQPSPRKRREYSEALKRQMVAETLAPGASVSIVARRHDVNSNQLFRWRRQLLPKAAVESRSMVPVEIAPDGGGRRRPDREGVIEIAFGCGARVRLCGEVSSETLRRVIELLR
jgi:transposase